MTNKGLYILSGIAVIGTSALAFFLGHKKGYNDCFKYIISKNETLNF